MIGKLNVLVVDDSPTIRQMLTQAINAAPDMCVVGEARNGLEALKLTFKLRPSVIVMDLVMPGMDGLEATREIMHEQPTPIVVVSASLEASETDIAFEAVRAGALTVFPKPQGWQHPLHAESMTQLLKTVRALAGVQVIHHHYSSISRLRPNEWKSSEVSLQICKTPQIVAIASSTGGPAALSEIVSQLPADFPVPVVIVQHMTPDFVSSLAGWLAGLTPMKVNLAEEGNIPQPGSVHLAPGGIHLRIGEDGRFRLSPDPTSSPHTPSCDVFLESVAHHYGAQSVGVILTGMGKDGARGLMDMFKMGAYTIAQDEPTSIVFGMPREAIALGAARRVLPLSAIPVELQNLAWLKAQGKHHYGQKTRGTNC